MTHASASPANTTAALSGHAGTAAGKVVSLAARSFLKSRGLSESILARMPVAFGTDRGRECVFFGQVVDGESRGYKARPLDAKDFWQKSGTAQQLWNLDQVRGSERVWLTEGEIDACSLVEAGISPREVVSVFGGAKGNEPEANLKQAQEALEQLQSVREITLCTDADGPGRALRQALATVLGAARCRFVEWPEGIKDANEMLVKDGAQALRELVTDGAQPWPVEGLYRLSQIPEAPPLELWDAGLLGNVKLAPTHLSVVTGHGGHGKTRFMAQVWATIAKAHSVRVALCTMETLAKPGYRRYLREVRYGADQAAIPAWAISEMDAWIEDHYRFIQHPQRKPGLKWLLDVAEVAVVREGCRAVVVDPWNKLERGRPEGKSETDYIGEVLDELMLFAVQLNCHVQVVAHPAKVGFEARRRPPSLEDIAGSKAWETKPDQGFCVWRPEMFKNGQRQTDCQFIVLKTRFEELGYPRTLDMRLNLKEGRYESAAESEAEPE